MKKIPTLFKRVYNNHKIVDIFILRDAAREEEPDDYRGLYGRSWDV